MAKLETIKRQPALFQRCEALLADFEPNFEFVPVDPLPPQEYEERLRRIRREAVMAGYDALIVHADMIGWYHTSNSYLRYICDWMREGVLIIPSDNDKPPVLLTFFGSSVLLPPAGEPVGVEEIWQIGIWGREYLDRPGSAVDKAVAAAADTLRRLGLAKPRLGAIGDRTSTPYWDRLRQALPGGELARENGIVERMQRVRTKREQAIVRAAAQLIDIGTQAAYHVIKPGVTDHEIYAAFTYAQLARGGETGDGYQIGVNRFGTHCGKPYGHVVRSGDLINIYVSNVTYRGYYAQTARMIAVGPITSKQEEVIELCTEGVRRAARVIKPGALVSEVNNAAFEPLIEKGYLDSPEARTMPFNWESMPDGSPRPFLHQYVPDEDWERQGRKLMHVYPATHGPHNPNLGHAVSMPGMHNYNISSHNYDRLEPGMTFVLHMQWLEPLVAGCNVGDCYLVTETGGENLSCHTPVELHRVPA
jgi:Xaa-Pro aminopeptidase